MMAYASAVESVAHGRYLATAVKEDGVIAHVYLKGGTSQVGKCE